jgi:hypothetical protein
MQTCAARYENEMPFAAAAGDLNSEAETTRPGSDLLKKTAPQTLMLS